MTRVMTMTNLDGENKLGEFLDGPVVKNVPCSAGDIDLIPGRGTKIPLATKQLSLRAATTEPECRNSHHMPMHHSERYCLTQRRSCTLQLRPNTVK